MKLSSLAAASVMAVRDVVGSGERPPCPDRLPSRCLNASRDWFCQEFGIEGPHHLHSGSVAEQRSSISFVRPATNEGLNREGCPRRRDYERGGQVVQGSPCAHENGLFEDAMRCDAV
jgi:hypothetical protein